MEPPNPATAGDFNRGEARQQDDVDTACGGRVPIKVAALVIALVNILLGIVGFPIAHHLLETTRIYGYGTYTLIFFAGCLLMLGIFIEKPVMLNYFRTYQFFMNVCAALFMMLAIFLQFNPQPFITKYWPSEENTILKYYTDEEISHARLVLGAYAVSVGAYLCFGIYSMFVVKPCMKFLKQAQKDARNYMSYT